MFRIYTTIEIFQGLTQNRIKCLIVLIVDLMQIVLMDNVAVK